MARRVVLAGCAAVLAAHVFVLLVTRQNPIVTPISHLSAGQWGFVHTAGLVGFAIAHLGLWCWFRRPGPSGRFWRWGRTLLLVNAVLLVTVAAYFALASAEQLASTHANDPLSLLASVTGLCMGLLARGLNDVQSTESTPSQGSTSQSRSSTALYRFNLASMIVWLALVPLILLVDASWLGAYERLVGAVFVLWLAGLAIGYPGPRTQLEPHMRREQVSPGAQEEAF